MVEQQHRKTYVQILKELAKLHARQGEAIQARQMLETAVLTESTFCPKTSEQKLSLATIRNDLALLCMELQDMDAALQHYQTALNLQREASKTSLDTPQSL
ncbi:expressed unknown protein [Seminavis robusta]|uniref:Uncharacterized protein n=1 Tax=Seminavis robusta TaxID=568900 RepID=A0A9N8F0D5_9STRA|nr:expressed unknown protein [Seminavis robusta]|eukprot:Sro2576_g331760.1 n/a (101) ;mRNA; f:12610-12912